MLRSNHDSSFLSSVTKGNRPYQLTILVLIVTFGWYALVMQKRYGELEKDMRFYPGPGSPGGPMMQAAVPICECKCQCDRGGETPAATSVKADNSKALVATPAAPPSTNWQPITDKQSYSSLPQLQSGSAQSHMQFVRAAYPPVGPEKGSIIDPSYLATPISYGTFHVPEVLNDGFPTGFIPRPGCQKDSDIVQNYIYKNQHPDDCKTKKLFIRRHMPGYGLFAGLGLSSNYVFLAAILGRTLIDLSPNTYFTGNCDKNGLECAFLPISSCTTADFSDHEICYDASCWDSARVISIDRTGLTDFLPCSPTEFPKQRCNQNGGPPVHRTLHEILPELGPHGEQFLQQEFTRYLTRPNKKLQEFTEKQMRELELTDQTISVHIRHGDKEEGIQFPTRAYALVVRRVVQITGIKTVFIGSDDRSVYEELPKWVGLDGVRYRWMNDPNPVVFSANQAREKGHNTIGMFLMAQTVIFLQSQAYIGTRSSNAGQVVYAMQGNDCSRQKIAYDMYGDLFYNSWYCRGDIEHAGREWMCALQKPGPGEGLIWKWGGARTECH